MFRLCALFYLVIQVVFLFNRNGPYRLMTFYLHSTVRRLMRPALMGFPPVFGLPPHLIYFDLFMIFIFDFLLDIPLKLISTMHFFFLS